MTLHPDFSTRLWDAKGYAPLVVTGPILGIVRDRLARRVAMLESETIRRGKAVLAA